ncbi:hypothetical protein SDC9_114882 [bioreactor metagenome]|uniref:Uncharacterized protein n=1 Tax=bioreactor metagenome TaxID=1076179 RepID=A0A645BRU7_9ZZZZ
MPQAAFTPILPVRAAQRGDAWSVPRMRAVWSVTVTTSPSGTLPPHSCVSSTEKSTRKLAQQAPQERQGWAEGMVAQKAVEMGGAGPPLFLKRRAQTRQFFAFSSTHRDGLLGAQRLALVVLPEEVQIAAFAREEGELDVGILRDADAWLPGKQQRIAELGFEQGDDVARADLAFCIGAQAAFHDVLDLGAHAHHVAFFRRGAAHPDARRLVVVHDGSLPSFFASYMPQPLAATVTACLAASTWPLFMRASA